MKGKKLTNMRTQGTDENVVLTPVRKMAIAEQLGMLNTDEALEITPKSCRRCQSGGYRQTITQWTRFTPRSDPVLLCD